MHTESLPTPSFIWVWDGIPKKEATFPEKEMLSCYKIVKMAMITARMTVSDVNVSYCVAVGNLLPKNTL